MLATASATYITKLCNIEPKEYRGLYCKFSIPNRQEPGVYFLVIDSHVVYIGKTKNLSMRWNMGYCVADGRHHVSTNERINKAILAATLEGKHVELWFIATPDIDELEEGLIREHEPLLNIEFTSRDKRAS